MFYLTISVLHEPGIVKSNYIFLFTHLILHRDENKKNYLKVDLYKNSVFDSDLRFSPSLW